MRLAYWSLIAVILIFSVWKFRNEARFSISDLVAVSALLVSLALGTLSEVSKFRPPHIDARVFLFSFGALAEENKAALTAQILVSYGEQVKGFKEDFIRKHKTNTFPATIDEMKKFVLDKNVSVRVPDHLANQIIGAPHLPIPLILGISFFNEAPNSAIVENLALELSGEKLYLVYSPMMFVNCEKYSGVAKKYADFLDGVFHPIQVAANDERTVCLLFYPHAVFTPAGDEVKDRQIIPDRYEVSLVSSISGKKQEWKLPATSLNHSSYLELIQGTRIAISPENPLLSELRPKRGK